MKNKTLILASASPRRADLLAQIGIVPDRVLPASVDETPAKNELPDALARRLAQDKAAAIHAQHPDMFVLGADTVVACGRRVLPKAETAAEARACLELLSGRRHRVHSAICVIAPDGRRAARLSTSVVQFMRLDTRVLDAYLDSGEWQGKAGGYAIQGRAGGFVTFLSGSYSGVVGLPLYDTLAALRSVGFAE